MRIGVDNHGYQSGETERAKKLRANIEKDGIAFKAAISSGNYRNALAYMDLLALDYKSLAEENERSKPVGFGKHKFEKSDIRTQNQGIEAPRGTNGQASSKICVPRIDAPTKKFTATPDSHGEEAADAGKVTENRV
jgi:hypothetical protein